MKVNYQKESEKIISSLTGRKSLILHSCCGPCSSYVLEYLSQYFDITVAFYNPNIEPYEEYEHRLSEQRRLIKEAFPEIKLVEIPYDNLEFCQAVEGLESLGEGSERCFKCFEFRMKKVAEFAGVKYDYFTTTLSVSPYKNCEKINELGFEIQNDGTPRYFPADFKKKNGYKRSIELSKEYNLYRQNYCGCRYSLAESLKMQSNKK